MFDENSEPAFIEDEENTEPEAPAENQEKSKIKKPYSNIACELNEEDLNSKGVQKLILSEISRLENENAELDEFKDKYYSSEKECAINKVLLSKSSSGEILYSVALSVASALLGLSVSIEKISIASVIIVFAFALLLFAIIAKIKGIRNES